YGNGFPVDKWEGMDLLLIAAGLGTAPLRSVFLYAMDNRWKYGNITFINTARYGKDLLFYKELEAMKDIAEAENVKIIQSVTRDPDWPGPKGRPQNFIVEANTNPKNTAVAICGPPRMYKDVFEALIKYGYRPENIYVTLERMMKCGIGKCGHCNVGTSTSWKYVCKDGPVFTYFDIVSTPGMLD
ncbi:MAG: hypothetical protein PWQ32_458, partial [Thermococcaceae archaeon]|nr:hypothetical protein [Thermococcaceae archaeon]